MKTNQYLFLLAVFRVSRSLAAGMITIAFPYLILTTLHQSPLVLGLLYTSAALATAALGLFFGFLTDVWGQKKTLITVGLTLPLSSALIFASGHLLMLFIACMLGGYSATGSLMGGGVGGAAQPIQIVSLAQLTTTRNRTSVFSLFTFISGIFAAFGALMARLFSVHNVFLAATIISLLGIATLAPVKFREYRGNIRTLSSKSVIGKFSLTGALNGFASGLVIPFLIPFFVIVYHLPKSQMSVYGFIAGSLGSCAILVAPRLERFWGFVRTVAFTRGFGTVLLLAMPLFHLFPLALAIYLVTPAFRVMSVPVQQTALTELVNVDEIGRALGLNQVARLTSSSGAIAFTGYMFDIADFGLPFYAYALVMSLNIYLYFRFFKSMEDQLDPERVA
ncbi:MAG: MFS transporter [Candidatus Acidiferrales bacterium]